MRLGSGIILVCVAAVFRSATSASRPCCSVIRACVPCAACVDELSRRRPARFQPSIREESLFVWERCLRATSTCERPSQGSTRCPFQWPFEGTAVYFCGRAASGVAGL
ncbi:hypothetical protein MRX96_032218 [Rhipicephalus microplus]